jgi:hypothetical protein
VAGAEATEEGSPEGVVFFIAIRVSLYERGKIIELKIMFLRL